MPYFAICRHTPRARRCSRKHDADAALMFCSHTNIARDCRRYDVHDATRPATFDYGNKRPPLYAATSDGERERATRKTYHHARQRQHHDLFKSVVVHAQFDTPNTSRAAAERDYSGCHSPCSISATRDAPASFTPFHSCHINLSSFITIRGEHAHAIARRLTKHAINYVCLRTREYLFSLIPIRSRPLMGLVRLFATTLTPPCHWSPHYHHVCRSLTRYAITSLPLLVTNYAARRLHCHRRSLIRHLRPGSHHHARRNIPRMLWSRLPRRQHHYAEHTRGRASHATIYAQF